MSRRRTEGALAAIVIAGLLTACQGGPLDTGFVDPQSSPCAVAEITMDPDSVDAGATLTVIGEATGCDPGIPYEFQLVSGTRSHLFGATAEADGSFRAETTVPADFPVAEAGVTVLAPFQPCPANASCALVTAAVQINAAP